MGSWCFMRWLRPLLMAVVLAGVVYYFTDRPNRLRPTWVAQPGHLELTEAAAPPPSYDAEEQENITVYKKSLPAVVNITATAVTFDFFYGPVPQQGQGSGFVIDSIGHILTNYHV